MYSNIVRSDGYKTRLLDFIRCKYGIDAHVITFAKRGFYGETWRLRTTARDYFVKLNYSDTHKYIYERSFTVMEHLSNHGINSISKIVRTADGRLSALFDSAILGVFDWLDGENIETDETKISEYQMLAKIYTVPTDGLSIQREDFSGNSSTKFFEQWSIVDNKKIRSLFEKNCANLERRATHLKRFAELCRNDTTGFVITHGDAGGNIIVNGDKYWSCIKLVV